MGKFLKICIYASDDINIYEKRRGMRGSELPGSLYKNCILPGLDFEPYGLTKLIMY